MRKIDFRNDTVTLPTEKMRHAIFSAELGDDVLGEDFTVNKLQSLSAEITEKEASLLVTSGTMGNQLSIKVHTVPGNEIILEEKSHIFLHEVGASAVHSGVQTKALKGVNGILNPEEVESNICLEDDHTAGTKLICLENPHNMAGGVVMNLDIMKKFRELADKYDLKLHLDGARLFNAATYLKVDVKEITQYVDSVTFCLSKGLCAPVGSMLCGTKEFISKAHRYRKMFGGGMRQAGIIAAPGIIAIEDMSKRLDEDHENATILAEGISRIPGLSINLETVQTNMIFFSAKNASELVKSLEAKGILCWNHSKEEIRMVTHYYITIEDILYTLDVLKEIMKNNM